MNLFEWMRLPQTRRGAEKARRATRRQGTAAIAEGERLANLEDALERSMALNLALAELLVEKQVLTESELDTRLGDLELRAPVTEDGPGHRSCVSCKRMNRGERVRCYFCAEFMSASGEAAEA